MNTQQTNVVLHIAQPERDGEWQQLAGAAGAAHGVTRTRIGERGRMLLVWYDPHATNARTILDSVEAAGARARLIGM